MTTHVLSLPYVGAATTADGPLLHFQSGPPVAVVQGGRRSASVTAPFKRSGSYGRGHAKSVATLVLARPQQPALVAPVEAAIDLCTDLDVKLHVNVDGARPEPEDFPEDCLAGSSHRVTFINTSERSRGNRNGSVKIDGFVPVEFHIARGRGTSYVGFHGRRRYSEISHDRWNWTEGAEKPTEGRAADFEIIGHCSLVKIHVRAATEVEVKRACSLQALRDAAEGGDYDTFHAQWSKARTAGVELVHLNQAEEHLKRWRKQGLHVSLGCSKDSLRTLMQWGMVTTTNDSASCDKMCKVSADCPCNAIENPGESLLIIPQAVQSVLGEHDGDKMLFEDILDAALNVEEGSVWRAGGKFIFSAFSRNQSVNAMMRTLQNHGKERCARLLLKLVQHSESTYGGYVTAAQVNFHPNHDTYHDQHRDVYSAKQRAGPNCNCAFKEAVGTVCYSLGSSRRCKLETMTDEFSAITSCGDQCEGCTKSQWLHSGSAMYFNDTWNQNHTHGIPKMEGYCGPRISIAFLLGAADIPKLVQ